jgi:hypothetical protein
MNKDKECKCGYTEEKDLLKQFEALLETISLNELEMKDKIKIEVEKFKQFNKIVLGIKDDVSTKDVGIRNYAKYILRSGNDTEKRELLGCLKSKILLSEKIISLTSG